MTALLGNRKYRDIVLQVAFVMTIVIAVAAAIWMTRRNLAIQGVVVGWDFLDYTTGWTLSFSLLPYDIGSTYRRALLVGFCNTLLLGTITLFFGSIIGGLFGAARLSPNKLISGIALAYVQFFRNIPLILQAFFWYTLFTHLPNPRNAYSLGDVVFLSNRGFFFPALNIGALHVALAVLVVALAALVFSLLKQRPSQPLVGSTSGRPIFWSVVAVMTLAVLWAGRLPGTPLIDIPALKGLRLTGGLEVVPELSAAIVAISLFGGSYIAEIVRSGLLAVSKGRIEAGHALGLTPRQIFWHIRLPLAIRIILPMLTNQYVWLMKATSIGLAIGFADFFMVVANSINHSGQTLTLILILILGFWAINFSLATVMNWINRSIALRGQNLR